MILVLSFHNIVFADGMFKKLVFHRMTVNTL